MTTSLPSLILLKGIQPPELFSGKDEQDPITWLLDMDQMFDAAGTKPDERRRILPMYLGGNGKKWYRNGIYDSDYDTFKQKLIDAFTTSSQQLKISSKLMNRHQGLNESVPSYYYDVLSLCTRFNPETTEKEKVLHLLRGLKPSLLQAVLMFDPSTCNNLLEQAKRAEAATSLAQLSTITTTTTVETDDTTAAMRRASNSPISGNSHPQQPKWDTQDYRRSDQTYYGGSRPQWSHPQRYSSNYSSNNYQ
ncbi:unnamed protein product [Didymodactylos carnosus]|uniref:Retrotransposon gag domain-containing protein n=1 Tax=Didymodactylos carnosus TaxID=1234261 RepID=A0A8S2F1R7_9BILA|nr:unnamed protein product [Didymodactylos carnosus]CAF4181847.1 unnamed protein product [Didymodactylos carnosus]CAF4434369.1 unnamed protein product [Didymodactylos carnosus]